MSITFLERSKVPVAIWHFGDVIIVYCAIFLLSILSYLLLIYLLGDTKGAFLIARYIGTLLMIFFPILWIKKRYSLSKEILGIKKGNDVLVFLLIAIILIFLYFFANNLIFNKKIIDLKKLQQYFFYILIAPLSISGFVTIILTPLGEEILDRGFLYSYLRKKTGVVIGLIIQALIFSLLHVDYVYSKSFFLIIDRFLLGLIFGILYEKTGSIYPSVICHAITNYLSIISKIMFLSS